VRAQAARYIHADLIPFQKESVVVFIEDLSSRTAGDQGTDDEHCRFVSIDIHIYIRNYNYIYIQGSRWRGLEADLLRQAHIQRLQNQLNSIASMTIMRSITMAAWLLLAAGSSTAAQLGARQKADQPDIEGEANAAAAPQPTGPCEYFHAPGFDDANATHHITSSGIPRYYGVYVPPGYDHKTSTQWPLIFDFHGRGATPREQYENSQYYLNTRGRNYVVVYPQGYEVSWQGASYTNDSVNDLQFVTDLLAKIQSHYCIDPNRIYASGKSNGGGFVDTLACSDEGDPFAAFAMAAPALYTDNSLGSCTKKRAILEAHGTIDKIIPYTGGPGNGGELPDIDEWVSWWGKRTCGASARTHNSSDLGGYTATSITCDRKSGADLNNIILHYKVTRTGHCWPSITGHNYDALNQPAHSCRTPILDFTDRVMDFFDSWNAQTKP
jgi:poly(3-hydroxybutyrate) depolymerase